MRAVAVFSLKGGVGKTTAAVNLAWALAHVCGRRTLLWDVDAQAAASHVLGNDSRAGAGTARRLLAMGAAPGQAARPTATPNLHLIAADKSLRHLERQLEQERGGRVLKRLLATVVDRYDRIVFDCPPGFTGLAEQLFKAVDLVVEPIPPSPLGERAHQALVDHLAKHHDGRPPVLAAWSMVDRRRVAHRAALAAHPDRPALPYASVVETMATERRPLGAFAPGTAAARAYMDLVAATERHLI